ncbi:MAG TPA: FIST N-terminal domain-containing protein, partial [Myxococcota bacterium]|nr:FIST N-terminal domain-containing protein [Myxococcota bacterium]
MQTTQERAARTASGVGLSRLVESERAGREAVGAALQAAGVERADLVLLYATIRHDPEALLAGARAAAPGARIAGCSVQGVSVAGASIEEGAAAAAMAVRSSELRFEVAVAEGVGADAYAAGRAAGRAVAVGGRPSLVVCHWDPLTGADVDRLIQGLRTAETDNVIGGSAAQTWGLAVATWQLAGDRVLRDAVVAVGMHGGEVLIDTSHGAEPTGVEMKVTRASANVLQEIDGRPALDVWNEMTGGDGTLRSEAVGSWLLGVRPPERLPAHYGGCLTRIVLGVDAVTGSVVVGSAVPVGSTVYLYRRSPEAVVEGARALARRLSERLAGRRPRFALGFECGGRTAPFLGTEAARAEADD